jgi:hypothetical protein
VVIINPLGVALAHYTAAMVAMFEEHGIESDVISMPEPSAGTSRATWLRSYLRALRTARKSGGIAVISVWPVVGYLDFLLFRVVLGRRHGASLIIHDPQPLVFARGYGRFARWLASRTALGSSGIVHSEIAREAAAASVTLSCLVLLAHPVAEPVLSETYEDGPIKVRVLGQFKADRDVSALAKIASEGPVEWRYEVIGRNWPDIPGWDVDQRFVEEHEFNQLLGESAVVLIPYRRFFQSGVAIRSLEQSTPVVGPRSSSLRELLGADSPWLVDDEDWLGAIKQAVVAGRVAAYDLALQRRDEAGAEWGKWLERK